MAPSSPLLQIWPPIVSSIQVSLAGVGALLMMQAAAYIWAFWTSWTMHSQAFLILPLTGPGIFHPTYLTVKLMIGSCLSSNYNPHIHSVFYRVLDCLFKSFTPWCLRIVPAFFLRDTYRALCIPHALTVLLNYHSSQGDQTLGYTYFGMSSSLCRQIGYWRLSWLGMSTRVSQACEQFFAFPPWHKGLWWLTLLASGFKSWLFRVGEAWAYRRGWKIRPPQGKLDFTHARGFMYSYSKFCNKGSRSPYNS